MFNRKASAMNNYVVPFQVNATIDGVKIKNNYLCDEIVKLLKIIKPHWFSKNDISALQCKEYTGGISNQLYGYCLDGAFIEDVVLVRIYGVGTGVMIDRELEKVNIQALNRAGRCPPLHATFNNGIAYGFVKGVTLTPTSVKCPTIRRLIAKEMLAVHMVRPEGQVVESQLWNKLDTYLEHAVESFEDQNRQKQLITMIKPKAVLLQELRDLRRHLNALNSPIVFCHNDLLLKNIIFNDEQGSVHFIDHEYAMYNYEHFEIGNHFCEYAGVDDVDFNRYPDKSYQLEWLRYYLQQKAILNGLSADTVTDRDVEINYIITNKFALAAHLFWGIWSLVQARYSVIDFGFLDSTVRVEVLQHLLRDDEITFDPAHIASLAQDRSGWKKIVVTCSTAR